MIISQTGVFFHSLFSGRTSDPSPPPLHGRVRGLNESTHLSLKHALHFGLADLVDFCSPTTKSLSTVGCCARKKPGSLRGLNPRPNRQKISRLPTEPPGRPASAAQTSYPDPPKLYWPHHIPFSCATPITDQRQSTCLTILECLHLPLFPLHEFHLLRLFRRSPPILRPLLRP